MIVLCKCGNALSKGSLVLSDLWDEYRDGEIIDGAYVQEDEYPYVTIEKKSGTIGVLKSSFVINKKDYVGRLPKFVQGDGCCDHFHVDIICSSCGVNVGVGRFDCYQDRGAYFKSDNVLVWQD